MISRHSPDSWQDLQRATATLLAECGMRSELEKTVRTVRGDVELDVFAEERIHGRAFTVACECKHWKARVPKAVIHSFRTVVSDLGVNVGYIISTGGFQSGAEDAAELTNLQLLNWQEFQKLHEELWYDRYFAPTIVEKLDPLLTYTEPFLPIWFHDLSEANQQGYMALKDKYDLFGISLMKYTTYHRILNREALPQLPLRARFAGQEEALKVIPPEILDETAYREFLELCVIYGQQAINEFRSFKPKHAA
jgi:hypothetical protein